MAFWDEKSVAEMSDAEWEALCDGCARCCLIKLEDEDTGAIGTTSVVCELLDVDTCRCTRYPERHQLVPDCIDFNAEVIAELAWLPDTCAYRLLAEGKPLAWWHPLISGNSATVHEAGVSVRGNVVSETHVHPDELTSMIVHVIETDRSTEP